nr:reverse transcriptase domain-containing protein [Tanacetum cinerariifolium]
MSTRSSTRKLFPPLDNPELIIRRRPRVDPTLLNDFEMATNGNDDPPVPDLRTMEEFDAANKHIDKFLHVTQSIKVNGVTDDALPLYLFPHSLTHHATAWFDRFPRDYINTFKQMSKMFLGKYFPPSMVTKLRNEITNFRQHPNESLFEAWECYKLSIDRCPKHNMLPVTQIDTFYNGLTLRHRDTIIAAVGGTFMKRRPEECYDLIENMNAHHNDWDTSVHRSESSSSITSSSDLKIVALKAEMVEINKNLMKVLQINQQVKAVAHNCKTCGGPYSYNDCPATIGQTQNMNTASSSSSGTLPSNIITNPKEDLKGITTRIGNAYQGSAIPTTSSSLPKVVKRKTEVTKDTMPHTNNRSTKYVQPLPVQIKTPIPNYEPVVDPVETPISASKPNQKPSILYLSRLHDQKIRDKTNDQKDKFFKIFQDLDFNISFTDALILMPKFGATIKSLLINKEKLFELARTPLNKHCSEVLLKKLLEKLGDPDKFLIPCDFPRMDECLALADLGTSINLMPLSVRNKLSLPKLSPTCMTFELADGSISRLVGVAEDVFVKVGTFYFLTDFVVVGFDFDPRVPLILERSFLKIERDLIGVYKGELTLRVGKEAVTFNLDQTSRYSANYDAMLVNRIDLVDVACEEYSQEVLGFSVSGNPTPSTKPIVFISSPTLTPFEDNDFLLEETDAFLSIDDEPILPKIDDRYYDLEGDILFLEEFLNDDPSPPLPPQELKGDDKLSVIIAKDLKDEEKTALIKVLKSHKQDLAWQLFKIKVFMDDFSVFGNSFETCLSYLDKMLKRCEDTNLCLNWEKSHFMVKEGIVLGHKISKNGIEVDKGKVDVIAKLPHPTAIKGIRSFLGHADFYRRFIQDFLKIARPMTSLLEKDTPFFFSKECNEDFQTLKRKLTEAPILVAPNWDLPCELMCDATDFAIGAVMLKYGVTHRLATAYHPQTSGQVDVSNRSLKIILERTVGENCASWSDKLDDALWAFRTSFKTPSGCTPYKLVYGKACPLPIELEHKASWALKHCNYDLLNSSDHQKVQLNELNELRHQAYENSLIYKEKTKRIHDSKIKDRVFNVGD